MIAHNADHRNTVFIVRFTFLLNVYSQTVKSQAAFSELHDIIRKNASFKRGQIVIQHIMSRLLPVLMSV